MAKLKTGRHTSTIKASRQALRRAEHNRGIKKQLKASAKELLSTVSAKDLGKAKELHQRVSSLWDKAAKKSVIHWRTAARKKSRLAKLLNKTAAAK